MAKSTKSKTKKATKAQKPRKMKPGDKRFVDEIPFKVISEDQAKAPDENAKPPMTRGRKLDATKVRDIRARLAKGEKAADIAAVYDLHPSSVDDIRVGRTWSSVV